MSGIQLYFYRTQNGSYRIDRQTIMEKIFYNKFIYNALGFFLY